MAVKKDHKMQMEIVYDFLSRLARNNNKEWFTAHKDEYLQAQDIFNRFARQLIDLVGKFDEDIDAEALQVKDCTYRIYRDLRFSADKTPYKTHMGVYITKGGKKGPYAGYYFHMEPPQNKKYIGQNMLYSGMYMPDKKIVASFRDEISVNGDALLDAINKAKGFTLYDDSLMRRLPRGFEWVENPQWQRLLKLKDISLYKQLDEEFLFKDDNLAGRVAALFARCAEFNKFVNRCIEYALEENM